MSDPAALGLFGSGRTSFAFHRTRPEFDLYTTVFSSAGIDTGTALLLRYVQAASPPTGGRVLDLGCGHGVLGIVLAGLDSTRSVTFTDRDALACSATRHNLGLNSLVEDRYRIVPSLGWDQLSSEDQFDLVVANLPGKAGVAVLDDLIAEAARRAAPGAILGLVVVRPLGAEVAAAVAATGAEPLEERTTTAYQVVVARMPEGGTVAPTDPSGEEATVGAFDRGVYDRAAVEFATGRTRWRATTVTGVDEFDSLSLATELLDRVAGRLQAQPAVVVEPGQGHRALLLGRHGHHVRSLVSRDLLALRASQRLLASVGPSGPTPPLLQHAVTVADSTLDTVTMLALHAGDRAHLPWVRAEIVRHLDRRGRRSLLLTGRASVLGRIEAELLRRRPGRVVEMASRRNYRALAYQQGG
ncbi:MAG: methyltransferase [Acidimicrobiales bacterium]